MGASGRESVPLSSSQSFMYISPSSLSLSLLHPERGSSRRFVLRSARFDREDSQIREAALAPARASPEREREKKEDASRERNEAQWT